jgi:hypothetical protein
MTFGESIQGRDIRKAGDRYAAWEDEIVRVNYVGQHALKRCHALLPHRTCVSIGSRVRQIGIRANKSPYGDEWTEAESDYLKENYQKKSLTQMVKDLEGRTRTAVAQRCKVMKLNRRGRDGWYTAGEVKDILGFSDSYVAKLIKIGYLKAQRHNDNGHRGDAWEIREQAIYDFITTYPLLLQARAVDIVQLINIATKGDIKYDVGAKRNE